MQYHVVTFHKAASNWTRRLFRDIATRQGANIWINKPNVSAINHNVDNGSDDTVCIYRTAARKDFDKKALPGEKVVLCVRDPKDVLVSQYFSWLKSHQNNTEELLATRERLKSMSLQDGLRLLVDENRIMMCRTSMDWSDVIAGPHAHLVKYEALKSDFHQTMKDAGQHLGIDLPTPYLDTLHQKYSFESRTGRSAGSEDSGGHYRKGVAGDWVNYFDGPLTEAFNERYGPVCDLLGYERPTAAQQA